MHAARLPVENRVKPVPRKVQLELQYRASLQESGSHRTKRFVFEPTSSPNADADLPSPATPNPIGWKQSDSCFPKPITTEPMQDAMFDSRSGGVESAESKITYHLAQALRERLAIIHDQQSRRDQAKHVARLQAVSEKIDKLHAALPQPIDPRLAHYLQRKSYDKALAHLEGRDD